MIQRFIKSQKDKKFWMEREQMCQMVVPVGPNRTSRPGPGLRGAGRDQGRSDRTNRGSVEDQDFGFFPFSSKGLTSWQIINRASLVLLTSSHLLHSEEEEVLTESLLRLTRPQTLRVEPWTETRQVLDQDWAENRVKPNNRNTKQSTTYRVITHHIPGI